MMHLRRFLLIFLVAGSAAAFVLLYPKALGPENSSEIPLLEEVIRNSRDGKSVTVEVPWPSPPSASPLTVEPPTVLAVPSEPNAAQVFQAINNLRDGLSLASVLLDDTLSAVAQLHVDDMARRSFFSHETPEGITFEMRMDSSGYSYITAAENLGFASHVSLIVPDWMRSPPHRSNIENDRMRAIGVATSRGTWQGIDVIYAVAVFAVPR